MTEPDLKSNETLYSLTSISLQREIHIPLLRNESSTRRRKTNIMEQILDKVDINATQTKRIQPELGISAEGRNEIAGGLKEILANSYVLMMKTQTYHWNVRGKMFISVHELTEQFYNDLFTAADNIAERIRSLGHLAPASLTEFAQMSKLKESNNQYNELEMIQDLVSANELICQMCREKIGVASKFQDEATADMLTVRLGIHEKHAWMLRAFLEE